jgi:beta-galactosidase/beta-glucuronidase
MHKTILALTLLVLTTIVSSAQIPRPEHPRPQFERDAWLNLNGQWEFEFDFGVTGEERGWHKEDAEYSNEITVPYCPESKLSGIEYKDFMPAIWYRRSFEVPADWANQRVFVHFGAVDYHAKVWVNEQEVGQYYGGSVSFELEITKALKKGNNTITVLAKDDIRSNVQPAGKQSKAYFNQGCCKYTRVTGIWQTVWLEARPDSYVQRVRTLPDLDNNRFVIIPELNNYQNGQTFKATLLEDQKVIATGTTSTDGGMVVLDIKKPKTWSPDDPFLYDLKLELMEGATALDEINSYAGLRKIHIAGNKIYLNNKPIYLRFVLDQGFYPEGVWTAPTDADLKKDIELSMSVGFNGARLHEKIFEERFHYWADKLGYLTWGEYPDWGVTRTYKAPEAWINLTREWREEILRDYNHPSIITWTPMNKTHSAKDDYEAYRRAAEEIYHLTSDLDPTRPVNNASGFLHIKTDIWTVHDYQQNPENLQKNYAGLAPDKTEGFFLVPWGWYGEVKEYDVKYNGEPYVVDEYGGTFWLPSYTNEAPKGNGRSDWGYGKSQEEVTELIGKLTKVLLDNPNIAGYTYTQLTDVEQEVNGIFTFDREPKFDIETLRKAFGAPAAIEDE